MTNDGGLSEQDVVDAFRQFLGRDPESPEVVAHHRTIHADRAAFHQALIASDERADRIGRARVQHVMRRLTAAPPAPIDHEVSPALQARMLARIGEQWTRLGESEPHWSVLTQDRYRAERMSDPAMVAAFRESGARDMDLIDRFEARTGVGSARGVCIELGCGVGRVTRRLAERFDSVVGVDVSPGNLALCRAYMAEEGVDNVEARLVQGLEDFGALPDADYLFSVMTLQHNPPPIQKAILRLLLARLRPGGLALFQLQGEMFDYAFDAEAYLSGAAPAMEMHCLPRAVVLAELAAADMTVLDVVPDGRTGMPGSFTFYARKRG